MSAPTTRNRPPSSPPASRPTRPGWRDPRLAIGTGIVALCALLGARLLDRADDTIGVWSLSADKVAGQRVDDGDLELVRIHFGSRADADRYLSAEHRLGDGSVLTRDVGAGELLPRAALGRASDLDLVELPLTVPSQAVPATLREGSTVDVWVTAEGSETSELVLDDVPVLALPLDDTGLSPNVERQVIVGLAPDPQRKLPAALARLAAGTVVVTSQAGQ